MILVSTTAAPHHATYPAHMRQDDNRHGDHGQPSDPTFGAAPGDLSPHGTVTLHSRGGPSFLGYLSFPLRRGKQTRTRIAHVKQSGPGIRALDGDSSNAQGKRVSARGSRANTGIAGVAPGQGEFIWAVRAERTQQPCADEWLNGEIGKYYSSRRFRSFRSMPLPPFVCHINHRRNDIGKAWHRRANPATAHLSFVSSLPVRRGWTRTQSRLAARTCAGAALAKRQGAHDGFDSLGCGLARTGQLAGAGIESGHGQFISGVGRRGGRVAPGRDSTVGPRPNFSGSGNPSKESPLQKHKLDAVWVPPVPHIFQSTAESLAGGPRFISRQRLVDCFGVGTLTIPADHRPLFTHNLEER